MDSEIAIGYFISYFIVLSIKVRIVWICVVKIIVLITIYINGFISRNP